MIYGEFLITHLLLIETNNSKILKNYKNNFTLTKNFDIIMRERKLLA